MSTSPAASPPVSVEEASPGHPAFVAIDPRTGLHLRLATEAERVLYLAQPSKDPFDKPVRVGDVTIDTYHGPGAWFGGAGF